MTQQQTEQKNSTQAWEKAREETKQLIQPQQKHRLTLLNTLIGTTFVAALVVILYFFYLLFYPFTPLTIKSVSVTTPTVQQGQTAIYRISSCKNTMDTPVVYKKIVSPTTAEALTTSQGVVSPGCSTKDVPFHILSGTPPGKYYLYTEVTYQVNAVRDIHIYWKAGPFEVTK